jgi:hypothetical protein
MHPGHVLVGLDVIAHPLLAGKGAGMLGGAAVAGYFLFLFVSVA